MKLLRALVVLVVLALGTSSTLAAKPPPLYAEFQGGVTNTYLVVEQQSSGWQGTLGPCLPPMQEGVVCNYTVDPDQDGAGDTSKCLWDVDDHTEVRFLGTYIRPGTSVSITKCLIGDRGWVFGWRQYGTDLLLTIAIELDNGPDFTLSSRTGFCVGGPAVRTDSPLMEPIPDSNGGIGVPGTVTWTVTNTTDRTVRFGHAEGINAGSGNLGMSTYDDRWCLEGFPLVSSINGHADGGGFDANGVGYWWDE